MGGKVRRRKNLQLAKKKAAAVNTPLPVIASTSTSSSQISRASTPSTVPISSTASRSPGTHCGEEFRFPGSICSELISSWQLSKLEAYYSQSEKCPGLVSISRLCSETNLRAATIRDWFANRREYDANSIRLKTKRTSVAPNSPKKEKTPDWFIPLKYRDDVEEEEVTILEESDDFEEIQKLTKKPMTIRQKRAKLRNLTNANISWILTKWQQVFERIARKYSLGADDQTRKHLEYEIWDLKEIFQSNKNPLNPFTKSQSQIFSRWEEDFVLMMGPEESYRAWLQNLESFRKNILNVWDRLVVFAEFVDCTLQDAVVAVAQPNVSQQSNVSLVMTDLLETTRREVDRDLETPSPSPTVLEEDLSDNGESDVEVFD